MAGRYGDENPNMKYYNEYRNKYYNPDDEINRPGVNVNWKDIQQGFYQVEAKDNQQDGRLGDLEEKEAEQDARLTAVEEKNAEQDELLYAIEEKNTEQDGRLTALEAEQAVQNNRLDAIETEQAEQNGRLDAIETKDAEQDAAIAAINAKDAEQDAALAQQAENIHDLDTRLTDAEGDIQNENARNTAQDAAIADNSQRITRIEDYGPRISVIEAEQVTQNNQIAALQQKDAALDADVARIDAKDAAQDAEIENLKDKDSALDQDIADLDTRLDSVEDAIDVRLTAVEEKNTEQDAALANHETRIADNTQRNTAQETAIADNSARITALERDLEDTRFVKMQDASEGNAYVSIGEEQGQGGEAVGNVALTSYNATPALKNEFHIEGSTANAGTDPASVLEIQYDGGERTASFKVLNDSDEHTYIQLTATDADGAEYTKLYDLDDFAGLDAVAAIQQIIAGLGDTYQAKGNYVEYQDNPLTSYSSVQNESFDLSFREDNKYSGITGDTGTHTAVSTTGAEILSVNSRHSTAQATRQVKMGYKVKSTTGQITDDILSFTQQNVYQNGTRVKDYNLTEMESKLSALPDVSRVTPTDTDQARTTTIGDTSSNLEVQAASNSSGQSLQIADTANGGSVSVGFTHDSSGNDSIVMPGGASYNLKNIIETEIAISTTLNFNANQVIVSAGNISLSGFQPGKKYKALTRVNVPLSLSSGDFLFTVMLDDTTYTANVNGNINVFPYVARYGSATSSAQISGLLVKAFFIEEMR